MLDIDGTMGEGGGSILRLSAGFSVLFKQKIRLTNIRASRKSPGLRLQHMLGLIALKDLTNGDLSDVDIGTTELEFIPGNELKNHLEIKIRTAGSIALLSQTIQNACIKAENNHKRTFEFIGGGTFGLGAPDPYYLNEITYHYFNKMGYNCHINVEKNGYYPKGGAQATLEINPLVNPCTDLLPLNLLSMGNLVKINGNIIVSQNLQKPKVAERILSAIKKELIGTRIDIINYRTNEKSELTINDEYFDIQIKYIDSLNPGVGLNIWAEFDTGVRLSSGTVLGKKGVSSEKIGRKCSSQLLKQIKSNATVDEYLSDQIIPLMYLCNQGSSIIVTEISSHMETNINLLNIFKKREYQIEKLEKAWKFSYI